MKLQNKFVGKSPKIHYEYVDNDFSASSGLPFFLKYFEDHHLYSDFLTCLPKRVSNASGGTDLFGKTFLLSFLEGHDCLDDIKEFRNEPLIEELLKRKAPSVRSCGDWLRDFDDELLEKMNLFQRAQSRDYRKVLENKLNKSFDYIIDVDSTPHEQYGEKMEGLKANKDGVVGLDSLLAYDNLGFNHAFNLRPGATFSANGAPQMIDFVFSDLPVKQRKFFRGDSAFCNENCIRALMNKNVKFAMAIHGNTTWEDQIYKITDWKPWVYSDEYRKKVGNRKARMPKVELGSFVYKPGWSDGKLGFTVVVKRQWVEAKEGMFEQAAGWRYYGIITNAYGTTFTSLQQVAEFYHGRGNSENFIKEGKYGFDLKNFPCQSLKANEAFGRLALVAHNLVRLTSMLVSPTKPPRVKKIRRKYIKIAGEIKHRSRQIFLRIPNYVREEVEKLKAVLSPGAYDLGYGTG